MNPLIFITAWIGGVVMGAGSVLLWSTIPTPPAPPPAAATPSTAPLSAPPAPAPPPPPPAAPEPVQPPYSPRTASVQPPSIQPAINAAHATIRHCQIRLEECQEASSRLIQTLHAREAEIRELKEEQ